MRTLEQSRKELEERRKKFNQEREQFEAQYQSEGLNISKYSVLYKSGFLSLGFVWSAYD